MNSLVIEANRSAAKGGALAIGTITLLLFIGVLVIIFTQDVDWGGPYTWFFGTLLFGWMFSALINASIWLFQLSRFNGPLITISSQGVIDHFDGGKYFSWDEIRFSDWKRANSKGVSVLVFRIIPKKRPIKSTFLSVLGRKPLQYPAQYLSIPPHEIAQYMLEEVPSYILK